MIIILTHSPYFFSLERMRYCLKERMGLQRGPSSVLRSLRDGLSGLDIPFKINPPAKDIKGIVHVLSGVDALRYAIREKKAGKISKIIVGPNVTVGPYDYRSILLSDEIDLILQPSEWTRDFYIKTEPRLTSKISIWAAGVKDPGETKAEEKNCILVFQKNASPALLRHVLETLEKGHHAYKVLTYGSFSKREYFELLRASKLMIYLSPSESQGLALHEAWIRDVPTLVWNRGYFTYQGASFEAKAVSAPYLSPSTGAFFKDDEEFESKLVEMLADLSRFSPRLTALEHFTDRSSAIAYLSLIMA